MDEKQHSSSSAVQHEDIALKISMQFFAEELLPYLGIPGKVISFAPTELIHLEMQKFYQDFNLVMDDGTWKHFEFQSTNEGLNGLKRFRAYESLTSYQHKVPVTTYVLFSGNIRNPMTSFTEGVNTYQIIPIIMRSKNADDLFAQLQTRIQNQQPITKKDLIPLTLCLLMDGKMPLKHRVQTAYQLTSKIPAETVSANEIQKIEAVIYIMAEKFLESMDLEEIMEGISMTRLGQMLVNKGIEEGEKRGELRGEKRGDQNARLETAKKLLPLLDEKKIAEIVNLPLEVILNLKEE